MTKRIKIVGKIMPRVVDTSPKPPRVDPVWVAKMLGAEILPFETRCPVTMHTRSHDARRDDSYVTGYGCGRCRRVLDPALARQINPRVDDERGPPPTLEQIVLKK